MELRQNKKMWIHLNFWVIIL